MDKFSWTPYGQPKRFWWTEITNDFFKMSSGISKGPLLVIPTEGVPRSTLKISQGYPEGPPCTDILKICQRVPIYVLMTKDHLWTLKDSNLPERFLEGILLGDPLQIS